MPEPSKEMFNLTVDESHTFYVGQEAWLVDNARLPCQEVGAAGEAFAQQFFGISTKGFFRTPFGNRNVDLYDASTRVAREVKVGAIRLSGPRIREELSKDIFLLSQGKVAGIEWVFLRNPDTKGFGRNQDLMRVLLDAGIKVRIIGGKIR